MNQDNKIMNFFSRVVDLLLLNFLICYYQSSSVHIRSFSDRPFFGSYETGQK